MASRVRWEEENGQVGRNSDAQKSSSIDFGCTATDRNFPNLNTLSKAKPKEITVYIDHDNDEELNSTINEETIDSTFFKEINNESITKIEYELELEKRKENRRRQQERNEFFCSASPQGTAISKRLSLTSSNSHNTSTNPRNSSDQTTKQWEQHGKQATVDLLSALYGIILVVMGVAFPISQVISIKIPSHYYEGFYSYLYFVSSAFFGYIHILLNAPLDKILMWKRRCCQFLKDMRDPKACKQSTVEVDEVFIESNSVIDEIVTKQLRATLGKQLQMERRFTYGSFYLRMGAVVFGVGSMIYSGLEFAQYFDMSDDPLCDEIMFAVQPASRMLFTFVQMYFIFLNAKIQVIKNGNLLVGRFGMMHVIATNLCVWLNVIIQETKHEIVHHFQDHDDKDSSNHLPQFAQHIKSPVDKNLTVSVPIKHWLNETVGELLEELEQHQVERTLSDECQRSDLMGTLTQNASPFLFPCAIEYSLICAAIMYEIWKHSRNNQRQRRSRSTGDLPAPGITKVNNGHSHRRSPNHYSVDCTKANKGLFFGIFILVLSILAMILFVVLINREVYATSAVYVINVSELTLYLLAMIAVVIGMKQVSQLQFNATHSLDLDNILLMIALTGVISYNVFTIVETQFSEDQRRLLVSFNAITAVTQAITQTIFILGSSRRQSYTRRQEQLKPGREVVTFLMVTNFAMWAVITLEKSQLNAHPVQSQFFGPWPWIIITNISSPLAIFFRYHSTVCLCEIWKRCYKVVER